MGEQGRTLTLATELTIAWLNNPNTRVAAGDVPEFLTAAHRMISDLITPPAAAAPPETETPHEPAVSVRKSIASRDRIISLIDGKPYMSLARHLKVHGLTPDDYRARYGLRPDYPMVAPAYSEARRAMALKIGLGGKAAAARAAATDTPKPRAKRAKAPTTEA